MGRQILFYGLFNLFLGIVLFVVFKAYIPELVGAVDPECADTGLLSCGGLMSLAVNVIIMISVLGLAQIIYWAAFEREKEDITVKASASAQKFRVCPECHVSNDTNARFCTECGYNFLQKQGK
ncbi:MAG: zinc ribbon domain-containing protein [Candidatus Micrarchaeota archaeon]|nr:zinc ribbon domain-containing protein [Candidatus Micrarchaeota archaeon]